jgi:hypothetical protein
LDDLAKNQLKLEGVYRERGRDNKSYFVGLRIKQDGLDDDLGSPITGIFSQEVHRDCIGMRIGFKPPQHRTSEDAEGLLENSKNIEQVFHRTACDKSISPTEELKSPYASSASLCSKDLNPPHIPMHIPMQPSAASDTEKPETIALIEIVEKIRKAIANSDRALAVQIFEVLEGKMQEKLRNEVRDALAPSETKSFTLLAKAEFVKTSPQPVSKFKVGDRVQVRLNYRVNDELRGSRAVVLEDLGNGYYQIDFERKIKISDTQSKQIFRMDERWLQIVTNCDKG